MVSVKEVSSSNFGKIQVAITAEKNILYSLQDVCKLFGINFQNARIKIGNNKIFQFKNKREDSVAAKIFITEESIDVCLRLSEDANADSIYHWLKEIKEKAVVTINGYTTADLKDDNMAFKLLTRLKELEARLSVMDEKIEQDMPKVKLVDSMYGTKVPFDFSLITSKVKYKGLTFASIVEDLRSHGIFTHNNMPVQKYIDSQHFRVVKVITNVKSKEVAITKVLVYKKGVALIEELYKKKVGLYGR